MGDIKFIPGAYGGDYLEEMFKPFTRKHMDYWWHFREVLWAAQDKNNHHWVRLDGKRLKDLEFRRLISVSLTNYAVYTGLGEALYLHTQLVQSARNGDGFHAALEWKSLYSSLYSSLNAVANLTWMVVFGGNPFTVSGRRATQTMSASKVGSIAKRNGIPAISNAMEKVDQFLKVRHQLDHFWTIWKKLDEGTLYIDRGFEKGRIVLDPSKAKIDRDAVALAERHLVLSARTYNRLYKLMSVTGGYLDQYLQSNGWAVDYTPHTAHGGKRPLP